MGAGVVALTRGVSTFALWIVGLPRYTKRAILAANDFLLFNAALWLAMSLRLGEPFIAPDWPILLAVAVGPLIGIATLFRLGLYRSVTRFPGNRFAGVVVAGIGLSTLLWALLLLLSGMHRVPRSVVLLHPMLSVLFILGSRQVAAGVLAGAGASRTQGHDKLVLIYGAGVPGMQLLEALRGAGDTRAVGFIDPNPNLVGQYLSGLKVSHPRRLPDLIRKFGVDEVLLALPKARRADRQEALRLLEGLKVQVRALPAIEDVAAGRVTVSDLRHVGPEDLLGREPVAPDRALLARSVAGKSVMVTGAGGSIGSELARQIVCHRPAKLVLVDMSEAHLYQIDLEMQTLLALLYPSLGDRPSVVPVLGTVLDGNLMRRVVADHGVQTIYHAAAFKHVPIVEHNAVAGLRNNTFGTTALADVAAANGVERFVLISTDKAVNPSSIMGASKRLAEMALQARAAEPKCSMIFTMVRFGNVLDSSGSVMRRFRQQIEAGGPVTVTHPEVIRYFMSIPEAASLVIQAGAMASGGDVFVLDMGKPVKIVDLARSMIRLMGQEVRDQDHPDGDIPIAFIGLRDREKMFEELLLGENVVATEHPRIRRSIEPFLPKSALDAALAEVMAAMAIGKPEAIRDALAQAIESYRPREDEVPLRKPREAA
jgi:FlaA1/EpsC-like NDP-sugar epimerase